MKFVKVLETLINLDNVSYVEKVEEDELFIVNISFVNGGYCSNRFSTKDEQEELYAYLYSHMT